MKIYSVEIEGHNNQSYEDYDHWSYTYKLLTTRKAAEKYVTDEEKIMEILKKDGNLDHELYDIRDGAPIQFEHLKTESNYTSLVVWTSECIWGDDEEEPIGFKSVERPTGKYANICFINIHVVEKEVEEN